MGMYSNFKRGPDLNLREMVHVDRIMRTYATVMRVRQCCLTFMRTREAELERSMRKKKLVCLIGRLFVERGGCTVQKSCEMFSVGIFIIS